MADDKALIAANARIMHLEAALREIISLADDVAMHDIRLALREIVTICRKHLQN